MAPVQSRPPVQLTASDLAVHFNGHHLGQNLASHPLTRVHACRVGLVHDGRQAVRPRYDDGSSDQTGPDSTILTVACTMKLARVISHVGGVLAIGLLVGCLSPQVRLADRLAEEGKWDDAVAAYREAYKKAPFDETVQRRLDRAKTRAAADHYDQGKRAFDERRMPEALHEFKLALGLDPANPAHHAAVADALRVKESHEQVQAAKKLHNLGRVEEALAAYARAVELDPNQTVALQQITELTAQQRAAKQIGGSQEPLTLRFQQAKLKEVFEILARTAGVNVLFDLGCQ